MKLFNIQYKSTEHNNLMIEAETEEEVKKIFKELVKRNGILGIHYIKDHDRFNGDVFTDDVTSLRIKGVKVYWDEDRLASHKRWQANNS
ncbi:MAG TPA: hypothetical protein DCS66_22120 [Flavobacteriaceae bacterium]|nr:hypothetical protein [Flavobacteriaceae bacterium]